MSTPDTRGDRWLESKSLQFQEILDQKRWDLVDHFFAKMEHDGYAEYVSPISQLMSDEDVMEYRKWDRETNGSMATQMDDN